MVTSSESRAGWLDPRSGGGGSLQPSCRPAHIWHSRAPQMIASTSGQCGSGVHRRSMWCRRQGSGCACGQCAPVLRGPGGHRSCTCRVPLGDRLSDCLCPLDEVFLGLGWLVSLIGLWPARGRVGVALPGPGPGRGVGRRC